MWNRALSKKELKGRMHSVIGEEEGDGLVGYWTMEEGTGSYVNDVSETRYLTVHGYFLASQKGEQVSIEGSGRWYEMGERRRVHRAGTSNSSRQVQKRFPLSFRISMMRV